MAITGPSTLAAYLNALQMGFKTLAIQKRSNEVWQILGEAKTEFEKVKDSIKNEPERNLLDENESIANLRKYHMALQNIQISGDITEQIKKHHRDSSMGR